MIGGREIGRQMIGGREICRRKSKFFIFILEQSEER